jgi:hypothetical protein
MYLFIIKYKSINQNVRPYDGQMCVIAKDENEVNCLVETELKTHISSSMKKFSNKLFDIIQTFPIKETESRVALNLDYGWH